MKLNKLQIGMVVGALNTYAKMVNPFYARKLAALARKVESSHRAVQPLTLRRALSARLGEVSFFYMRKLISLSDRLAVA